MTDMDRITDRPTAYTAADKLRASRPIATPAPRYTLGGFVKLAVVLVALAALVQGVL
jgi:hypothetical protein